MIDEALEDGEAGLAAHLVIVAAKHGGEVEIPEIEAGKVDAVDGGDAARRGEAVLRESVAGRQMAAEPQGHDGNSRKAQAMSGLLHGSHP